MAEHWTDEQIEEHGLEEYFVPDALEQASDDDLRKLAELCEAEPINAEECLPCRAAVLLAVRTAAPQSNAGPGEDDSVMFVNSPVDLEENARKVDQDFPSLRNDFNAALDGEPVVPVVQQFAQQVHVLNGLVARMLEGPPIPPPNFTTEDLAVLIVVAEKWSQGLDARLNEGFALSDQQKNIKTLVDQLIARARRSA